MQTTETQLIRQASTGDLNAFNALVLLHQEGIFNLAWRVLGEEMAAADATQETFLTAFRKLHTFRGELQGVVGAHRHPHLLRYAPLSKTSPCGFNRRPCPEDNDDGFPLATQDPLPEEVTLQRELQRAIQACINALKPDQRVALVLCDVESYSYQEIANLERVSLGTVKSRISRARASVRECLRGVKELLPLSYRQQL
ncbi:MAG UNVERIFIED_CONTAM: sigma-70 family RNA polymerase sigma factor [Anaerolineae bacterium]